MIPYIFILLFSLGLAWGTDINYNKNIKSTIFLMFCIVVLNTIFAGARDFGVGYDTTLYIEKYFDDAKDLNLSTLIKNGYEGDYGFLFLAWLSTKLSDDPQALLFVTEFFIISFTLAGAYCARKKFDFSFVYFFLVYFLLMYTESLNLMRQFTAMSFLFWAFMCYFINGRYKEYSVVQFLAYFFHSSSIIFIMVPILYVVSRMENKRIKNVLAILVPILGVLVIASYYYFLSIIGEMNFLKEVYFERYGRGSEYEATGQFSFQLFFHWYFLLGMCFPAFLLFYGKKTRSLDSNQFYFAFLVYTMGFIAQQSVYIMTYFSRFMLYFVYIYIVYLAISMTSNRKNIILNFMYIAFIFLSWYMESFINIMKNLNWNYAYTSQILGIN